jgi:hypothetical protein
MTTISAFVERPSKRTNDELLEIFADYKRRYGDLGIMFMALHIENKDRIAALEERLAKLEAKRK